MSDSNPNYKLYYQRRLPHYQPHNGVFFLTFRLAFSLPASFQDAFSSYKKKLLQSEQFRKQSSSDETSRKYAKLLFAHYDHSLCTISGPLNLSDSEILGPLIKQEIERNDNDLYCLYCYTIMPNHVHLLLKPIQKEQKSVSLADIVKTIKGRSARSINQIFGTSGPVWAREYYDYWVRDEQEFNNIIDYIRYNPVKAKLVKEAKDWPWTWLRKDLQ